MSFNTTKYWTDPPPEPSPRLALWVAKIKAGWKPNARISGMGYSERARFFGVYLWEYFNVIYPMIREDPEDIEPSQYHTQPENDHGPPMNNGHILNIDAIKNAIPIKYREGDETKVDRIIPQQFGAAKDTDGNPVPVLFAYSVNQRGVCGYPIPGIVEFNGEVPEITEAERKNRPKDPAMFARIACSFPQPGEFYYMLCVSLAKELHWAQKRITELESKEYGL